jgi:hypothetical protein
VCVNDYQIEASDSIADDEVVVATANNDEEPIHDDIVDQNPENDQQNTFDSGSASDSVESDEEDDGPLWSDEENEAQFDDDAADAEFAQVMPANDLRPHQPEGICLSDLFLVILC